MVGSFADARSALVRLAGQPVSAAEFSHEVGAALQRLLAFDGWCLLGLDPVTGLRTAQFGGRGTEQTAEMARNEALMDDANKYADLAAAPIPIGLLSHTHPRASHSFRLNEILRPQGFHSEMRLVLRDHGLLWGALVLFREDPRRPFDEPGLATLCDLAGSLTLALRAYHVRAIPQQGLSPSAGVVHLAADGQIVDVSAAARQWLDDLLPGGDDQTHADDATRVVRDAALAVRRADGRPAATCVRTVSGHWLRVEASDVDVPGAEVAVVLHAATTADLRRTFASCHRFTPREAEVLDLLIRGLAGKHIARELRLSPLTVGDHLRAMYRKCRVSSRDELLARLN